MATISEIINNVFLSSTSKILSSIIELFPQILLAAALFIVTYIISHFVGVVTRKILYNVKIDELIRVEHSRDTFGATSLAAVYGYLVKWGMFVSFINKIVEVVDLGLLSGISAVLAYWLTKLFLVAGIIVTGLVVIDFFTLRVVKNAFMNIGIKVARVILIVVLLFSSLEQLDIKLSVAENIFLMVIGAALFAVSLALGIGFGFALKEEARTILRQIRKKVKHQ